MAKRGTEKSDIKEQDTWTGEDFKKDEEERLEKSGVEFVSVNRGTSKIPVKKTKTKKKPEYKGKIHSGRGTSNQ